jgi:hypothetical protein
LISFHSLLGVRGLPLVKLNASTGISTVWLGRAVAALDLDLDWHLRCPIEKRLPHDDYARILPDRAGQDPLLDMRDVVHCPFSLSATTASPLLEGNPNAPAVRPFRPRIWQPEHGAPR